ncbi:MAG: TRAP transporter large permease [Variovorax sp.]
MVALIVFGLFITLMLVGVPVIVAFGVSTLAGLTYSGFATDLSQLYLFPQQILEGVNAPGLLAVPFFVLAGNLMNLIGVTERIVRLASALVGHLRAGMAQVNVVGSLFFGGITGSAIADCAGIGKLVIQPMRERGYPADFASALTVASSVIGPTMWPSVPLLIYAFSASVSVERIFLAGIGPGVLIVASLMIYNRIVAARYNVPLTPRPSLREIAKTAFDGIWAIVAPLIIIGSILFGVATPTEAGVVACTYVLILGLCYRTLTWAKLTEAFGDTVVLTAGVMLIIGVSTVMSWLFAFDQVPQNLAQAVLVLTNNRSVFLALIIVFFLLLGTILEPIPAMVILIPVLLPLVDHYGIDRVHFGLIMVYGLLLGIVTPPVGIALFIVTRIAAIPFEAICIAVMPLLVPLILVLVAITFFPAVVLWVPNLILGPAR